MTKVGRRWIIVYFYAYSKGDDQLEVVARVVKPSTVMEAGSVNTNRTSDKSKMMEKLGQAGVAGVEGSTMESSVVHKVKSSYCLLDSIDLLNEFSLQVVSPPCCDLSANGNPAGYRPKW